jgi:hypothetical protein
MSASATVIQSIIPSKVSDSKPSEDDGSTSDARSTALSSHAISAFPSPSRAAGREDVSKSNFDSLRKILEKSPASSLESVKQQSPETKNGPVLPTVPTPYTPKAYPVSSSGAPRTTSRAPSDELNRFGGVPVVSCPRFCGRDMTAALLAGGVRRWKR